MSNPESNMAKEKRRHWGPLVGIAAVLLFAVVIGAYFLGYLAYEGNVPGAEEVQTEDGVTDVVPLTE